MAVGFYLFDLLFIDGKRGPPLHASYRCTAHHFRSAFTQGATNFDCKVKDFCAFYQASLRIINSLRSKKSKVEKVKIIAKVQPDYYLNFLNFINSLNL